MKLDEVFLEVISPYVDTDEVEISDDVNISEELGLDSLDYVDIILQLEEKLDISLDDADITDLATVGELKAKIKEKIDGKEDMALAE